MRQIVRDRISRLINGGKSLRVCTHEGEYALDSGGLPTRRDVDENQGAERRRFRYRMIGLCDQPEQAAHRGADQDRQCRRGRLRGAAGEQGKVVDELAKIILAVITPVAIAMTTRIGREAAPAFARQRGGADIPGVSGLAEAVCEYQRRRLRVAARIHAQSQVVATVQIDRDRSLRRGASRARQ